jgi:hypothetical protein
LISRELTSPFFLTRLAVYADHVSQNRSSRAQTRDASLRPLWRKFYGDSTQFGGFFNGGIEKIVYETPVRNRIGLQKAGTVYTSPAWSMNVCTS